MIKNIVITGIGGQGVVTASNVIAEAAFSAGLNVKKSEVRGISQRGGSVLSNVRFGDEEIFSPMISFKGANIIIVMCDTELEKALLYANDASFVITSSNVKKHLNSCNGSNMNMLGIISSVLPVIKISYWKEAIKNNVSSDTFEKNMQEFQVGRSMNFNI